MTTTLAQTADLSHLYSAYAKQIETYIMFRIAQRVVELTPDLKARDRAPINMSIGAPTSDPPKVLLDELIKNLSTPGIHTYSVPRGELYFRQAAADFMARRFGVSDIDPAKEVCSLLGSKEGLAQMFRGLITPSLDANAQGIILIPDPGYASYQDAIKLAGGRAYPIALTPENNYMPSFDDLYKQLAAEGIDTKRVKALVLNYPSNPLGATATLEYYTQVVAFAKAHQILIISDLAYSELYFEGEPKPPSVLEVPGAKDITVEFHTLSKPYAITGWRIGFAVGHAPTVDVLSRVKSTSDSGIFKALQKAGAFALASQACQDYVHQMNRVYKTNRDILAQGLQTELGWPSDILLPKATFYLWLPIPPRFASAEAFATALLEKSGIVVVPGTGFGRYGEGFFRLSVVNPPEELHQVIARMKADGFGFAEGTV